MPVTYGDIVRADLMALQKTESKDPICPECMQPTSQEELDMFGGLCEECSGAFNENT